MNPLPERIYLTGFVATGKSTAGRILAAKLGWSFLDLDEQIEKRSGLSVGTLFRSLGESYFRRVEYDVLRETANLNSTVISTGGGALIPAENRRWAELHGLVVCLRADVKTVRQRLAGGAERPLLVADSSLEQLFSKRESIYDSFENQVDTNDRDPEETAMEILGIYRLKRGNEKKQIQKFVHRIKNRAPETTIEIGSGLVSREDVGPASIDPGSAGIFVTDRTAWASWGGKISGYLENSDKSWFIVKTRSGEKLKTWKMVHRLVDYMLKFGLDRRSTLIAMGGGTVIDFAGFVAGTYMRGIKWNVIPTTLLAQIDSALGGKTGINFENRKNMIGVFHFPSKVWIDPEITASLPDGVFAQGIAELIKTGFISSPLVVEKLENTGGLKQLRRDDDLIAELVTCAVNVKVGILNIDTFEDDRRMALNLGHTTAHALERALPDRISHGDAVSIGLLAAGMISERMGIAEEPVTDLLRGLLAKYGLPLVYEGPAGDDLYDLCLSDKKFSYGETVWVLPERVGKVRLVRNVPERIVKEVFDLLRK